jgi:hypothetical protein
LPNDDFIPPKDDAFDKWQKHFLTVLLANLAKFGVTAADLAPVQAAQATWTIAYPAHLQAQQDAMAKTTAKDTIRTTLEPLLRGLAQKVHGTPGMTNAIRAEAGLPDRGGPRTTIGAPTTRPLGRAELAPNHTIIIHFGDETTPLRSAKPEGVQGCQVWSCVADAPPADPSGYTFLALDTRTPYTDVHPSAHAGKNVHFLLRWQNAKGDTGAWSDVITVRLPA